MRAPATRDVLVLCYHGLSADWPELTAIEPERFERQIVRLLDSGYRPARFTEAVTDPPAAKTLAITFDDACRSVYLHGFGVLKRLGAPATVFAPTAFIDGARPLGWPNLDRWIGTPYERELEPASWPELAELAAAGWEIGSHGVRHLRLTELADAAIVDELGRSREAIARRIGSCTSIAYPYGATDERVAALTREAGYSAGAAELPLAHRGDPLRFPRVFISRADSELKLRVRLSRPLRALQATRAWPAHGPKPPSG